MARRRIFDGGKARELREGKGLEISELVELIGPNPKKGKPWDRTTLSNVECGNTQPGLHLSHAWARALGIPRDVLMTEAPAHGFRDDEVA
jgi:transcriptional regulator with XRE-family HTH domain